jgi:polyphenol oxidase
MATQPGPLGTGDAILSEEPGVTVAIRTADCLPILIVDPRTRAVAAVHAGWRGVVAEIAPKATERMRLEFGSRPEDLEVAIGPGIGACCFEVGPEVAILFQGYFPERHDLNGRSKVDLVETVVRQLGRNGVTSSQIDALMLCSCCNPKLFESYRRDRGEAGRMVAAVGVRNAGSAESD